MKIAWVTPTDEKSAIFEYSKIVSKELSKRADLIVFGTTESSAELSCKYYSLNDEEAIHKLKESDVVIYNMGDNYNFHSKIFETYLKIPGIIILHDLYFENLLNGYFSKLENGVEVKKETIKHIKKYIENKVSPSLLHNFFGDSSYATGLIQAMFEPILVNALGVISHCQESNEVVSKIYPFLCKAINLPYKSQPIKVNAGKETSKIELTTVGYVNKEKRHDLVIQAIAENKELRNKIHYNIAGPYNEDSDYFKNLISIVNKFGLAATVTFHGQISKEDMEKVFSKTDVFINLRKPCLNTGSWSLVEELASGKPVVTENFGFARSLPDDVVIKLKATSHISELKKLSKILDETSSSSSIRKKYGVKSIEFVKENNSPSKYCDDLIKFAKEVISNKPLKHQQELSSICATYQPLVHTDSAAFKSFFNFSGIIKK